MLLPRDNSTAKNLTPPEHGVHPWILDEGSPFNRRNYAAPSTDEQGCRPGTKFGDSGWLKHISEILPEVLAEFFNGESSR